MKKHFFISLALIIGLTFAWISPSTPVFAADNSVLSENLIAVDDNNQDSNGTYKDISNDTPNYGSDADDKCVETALFGQVCDDNGDSIFHVLHIIIDIMTVGVGILAVVGISIVGIQYLTAGGNEEQTRKAKRRIFEIVIGLIVYVVFFALLSWLLPDYDASVQKLNYKAPTSSKIG